MRNSAKNAPVMSSKVRIAPAADIPAESSKLFTAEGKELLVCHSKGVFTVVSNRCSHADARLDCGRVRNGWIACPLHGARFELATGRAMNPPATLPIAVYPTEVVDGWVEAEIG